MVFLKLESSALVEQTAAVARINNAQITLRQIRRMEYLPWIDYSKIYLLKIIVRTGIIDTIRLFVKIVNKTEKI